MPGTPRTSRRAREKLGHTTQDQGLNDSITADLELTRRLEVADEGTETVTRAVFRTRKK